MKHVRRFPLIATALAAALLSSLAGCGGTGNARYIPDAEVARASLETALGAWRDGKPCGPIEGTPPIRVADSAWQNGEQIASFEIGDEQAADDGAKEFPVKLTLKKDGKVRDVRYVINGRDPVWIYSEADYKRMNEMGNGEATCKRPNAAKPRSSAGERGGR
jgi:predicted small lipoprotein YifL